MLKSFERAETRLHKAIDKLGTIVIGTAKAAVTLVCLGGSVAYKLGRKIRTIVDNIEKKKSTNNQEPRTPDVKDNVEENVNKSTEVSETAAKAEETTETVTDLWDAQVEQVEIVVETIEQLKQMYNSQILCLPPAVDTEFKGKAIRYDKTGPGRCRKGYRKIGNECVLIAYLIEQEKLAIK